MFLVESQTEFFYNKCMKLYFTEDLFLFSTSGLLVNEHQEPVYRYKCDFNTLPGTWLYQGGVEVGYVRQEFGAINQYGICIGNKKEDKIIKEKVFFKTHIYLNRLSWKVKGDWENYDYQIVDLRDRVIATISKEDFGRGNHYYIEIDDKQNSLFVVLMVFGIDNLARAHLVRTK